MPASGYPKVSIVIYCHNDSDGLAALLPSLLSQDYPEEFEIIVVNDGRDYLTEALVNSHEGEAVRVYHTLTPRDTRNLSRKKLALTLGIKAASHDAIVHVTSSTRVVSPHWLRLLAHPLPDRATELHIGYAPVVDATGNPSRPREHDRLLDRVHYLSSARCGSP